MKPYLQLQRLLPDSGGPTSRCLDADELSDWLETLPASRPVESARALVQELSAQRRAGLALRTRLKLLELLRDKAESLLPPIEERFNLASLPLPPALQQAVLSANELLKALGAGYAEVVAGLGRRWYATGSRKPLLLAATHGLRVNQRRLKLAYRVYARGSPNAWKEMHGLYRAAVDADVAGRKADNASESPEHIYLSALLLAFAEPAKFAAGDLDRVRFYIERYGHLAKLEELATRDSGPSKGGFLVRAGESRPGMPLAKWRDGELRSDDRILDCEALVAQLQHQIAGLETGKSPAGLGLPREAKLGHYQALLHNLVRLWRAPPSRRFPRNRFHPRMDMVVGCAALRGFISGAAYRRRSRDDPSDPPPGSNMSEWTVSDESPDGLALRYVGGIAAEVRVGEIVGLRPRGGSKVHVCIVRRAEAAPASLKIGVQVLASQAVAANISLPQPARSHDAKSVPVMLLPRLPGRGNAPALLAPLAQLKPGIEFLARIDGRQWLLRVAQRVEKANSCELFALERAGRAAAVQGQQPARAPAISN